MSTHESIDLTKPNDPEIIITRTFDAPRELVWMAWTDPKHIVNWWGPNGFTLTIEKMEFQPGGTWKYVMHGPDGTDYPNKSVFIDIVKPERIVYSHGGGKPGDKGVSFTATWTFEEIEKNKTKITGHQIYKSLEDRDHVIRVYGAIEGGKQHLTRFAEYVATL